MDSNASSCRCNNTPANPPPPPARPHQQSIPSHGNGAIGTAFVRHTPQIPPPNSTTFSLETLVGTFFTAPRRLFRSIVIRCPSFPT